ncbi:MAG: WD40/YVTN/BNR-like repeat-containing protein [Saprospiraceae bacterium]
MQIRMLALLLFFQSFGACQQSQEKAQALEANVAFNSAGAEWLNLEKNLAPATNIVFRSADGGQTWQDVSAGLPKDLGVGRVFADGREIFLCAERALYHSSTGSAAPSWEKGVPFDMEISDIFPGRNGPYISIYQTGFFKEIPGTGVLIPMHGALKDKTVRAILETPDGALFVGCESGLYKSADAGKSWKQVFAETGVSSLAEAEGVLICGTYDGLMRSTDGGEHWDSVLTEDGGAWKTSFFEGRFVAITQGPKSWQEGPTNRLRSSADGGKTWQRMDEGFSSALVIYNKEPIGVINDIKQAGRYLICSCDAGIFRSSDWGKNWEPVFAQSGLKRLQLAVSGNVVYAVKVFGC